MSLAELKAKSAELTKPERDELSAYLRALELANSSEWKAKVTARARRLEQAPGLAIESVERAAAPSASA